ncbi:MAG: glycosyltransferase family 39 protein [Vicinamibacteria bacterium]
MTGPRRAASLLVLVALAVGVLLLFQATGEPSLSWSDEIVYAVNGRRTADGLGLTSGFYDHRVVLEQELPTGDVHLPGHALMLAAAFRARGPSDATARLPSQLGFLAAALAVFAAGLRGCGAPAAWTATLLFMAWPAMGSYAGAAMGELTLVALVALWLLCWEAALVSEAAGWVATLGLLTGAALLHRETSLALIPPALLALMRGTPSTRARRLGLFMIACGPLAVLPLAVSAERARHPHFLRAAEGPLGTGGLSGQLLGMAGRNLEALFAPGLDVARLALALTLGAALLLLATARGRAGLARRTTRLAAYLVAAHALALLPLYPLRGWAAVRVLLVAAPPLCLALGCRLAAIERPLLRRTFAGFLLASTASLTLAAHRQLTDDRREARAEGEAQAAALDAAIPAGRPLPALVAPGAFLYGWLRYPTLVIWSLPESPRELARVVERAGADAVLLPAALARAERWTARLESLGFTARPLRGASGASIFLKAPRAEGVHP